MECTPGQWKIHKGEMNDCGSEFWITGNNDEGCVIAHVNSKIYDERIETEEAEANANLIASAPDLYEAGEKLLQWILDNFSKYKYGDDNLLCSLQLELQDALAKAKGKI